MWSTTEHLAWPVMHSPYFLAATLLLSKLDVHIKQLRILPQKYYCSFLHWVTEDSHILDSTFKANMLYIILIPNFVGCLNFYSNNTRSCTQMHPLQRLVRHMVQLNPEDRFTVEEYLRIYKGNAVRGGWGGHTSVRSAPLMLLSLIPRLLSLAV